MLSVSSLFVQSVLWGIVLLPSLTYARSNPVPPQIILSIIVDDLGHHNVGWNQNLTENQPYYSQGLSPNENLTPHLTGLAKQGIILNRFYAHFTCTPSRSSFLSGRLPVHVQTTLANPDVSTAGIPRNMTTLPQILARSNYISHVIGKWDVGFATPTHTPEGRGFNTSLVYAEHMNYYWTQRICPTGTACSMDKYSSLVDLWDTGKGAATLNGTAYIDYLFRDRLMEIIDKYEGNHPLYIHYCPHTGHWPLQVPEDWYNKFLDVENDETDCGDKIPWVWPGANKSVLSCRRQYVAMVSLVDEIVGNLTSIIKAKGWWNQTLMTFSSDNGASISPDENAGSSYPLRGGKYTLSC
jgi:arylsulfatase B